MKSLLSKILLTLTSIAVIILLIPSELISSTDIVGLSSEYSSGLVKIQWQTTSETNIKEFIVEKSSDNILFNRMTSETPKGSSSSYSVFDANPHSKSRVLYYRITVVDYDGYTKVSDAVSARIDTSGISTTWGSIKALFR